MSGRFTGRTVLVTGGTRGLGRGLADAFAAEGADVVVCGRTEAGPHPFLACDVRDPDAVQGLVDAVVARTGRLDVVVNNAGDEGRRRARGSTSASSSSTCSPRSTSPGPPTRSWPVSPTAGWCS